MEKEKISKPSRATLFIEGLLSTFRQTYREKFGVMASYRRERIFALGFAELWINTAIDRLTPQTDQLAVEKALEEDMKHIIARYDAGPKKRRKKQTKQ